MRNSFKLITTTFKDPSPNSKAIIGLSFLLLTLNSCSTDDPEKFGKEAAINYCKCVEKYPQELLQVDNNFLSSFDPKKFQTREEAKQNLYQLRNQVEQNYLQCTNASEQKKNSLRNNYITNEEKLRKFDFAFNAQQNTCTFTKPDIGSINEELRNKIALVPVPAPTIDEIKNNLLGHRITFASKPDRAYDFNQFDIDGQHMKEMKIISSSNSGNSLELKLSFLSKFGSANMGKTTEITINMEATLNYTLINDAWVLQSVIGTKYDEKELFL